MRPVCVADNGIGNDMADEADEGQRRTQALNSQQRRELGRYAQLGDRMQMQLEDAMAQNQAGDLILSSCTCCQGCLLSGVAGEVAGHEGGSFVFLKFCICR